MPSKDYIVNNMYKGVKHTSKKEGGKNTYSSKKLHTQDSKNAHDMQQQYTTTQQNHLTAKHIAVHGEQENHQNIVL